MIHPEAWAPAGGLDLEKNARRAATIQHANVVVAAGPGAGKTELLAQRADFLLRTGACPYPRKILAISFKVDAARNLGRRVRDRSGPRFASRFDSFTFHAFAKRLIDNYRPALVGSDELDSDYTIDVKKRIKRKQITFDDLVSLAVQIIRSNSYARGGLRQTYSHVLLDEFQDCTAAQYDFITSAFMGTETVLTAVGDTKQRIMAFAGALDGVFQVFAEDFDAEHLPLYENFRSAPRLLRMQNQMIAEMDPSASRPKEELTGEEGLVDVLEFSTDVAEAAALGQLIDSWIEEGSKPSEIAVLVRQWPHLVAARLIDELARRGIPFRNEQQSQDLAAEPAAALIFNFLRVVADSRQPEAYAELVRVLSPSTLERDSSLFEGRLSRAIREARTLVRGHDFQSESPESWETLVREFLRMVSEPVLMALSHGYAQGERLESVVEGSIRAFGNELILDGSPSDALRRLSDSEAVRCFTIHKCKGLEFKKVIVLGVEEELFWGDDQAASMSEFFVAVSRAEHHLVLTHAQLRPKPQAFWGRWDVARTPHARFLSFASE